MHASSDLNLTERFMPKFQTKPEAFYLWKLNSVIHASGRCRVTPSSVQTAVSVTRFSGCSLCKLKRSLHSLHQRLESGGGWVTTYGPCWRLEQGRSWVNFPSLDLLAAMAESFTYGPPGLVLIWCKPEGDPEVPLGIIIGRISGLNITITHWLEEEGSAVGISMS